MGLPLCDTSLEPWDRDGSSEVLFDCRACRLLGQNCEFALAHASKLIIFLLENRFCIGVQQYVMSNYYESTGTVHMYVKLGAKCSAPL